MKLFFSIEYDYDYIDVYNIFLDWYKLQHLRE